MSSKAGYNVTEAVKQANSVADISKKITKRFQRNSTILQKVTETATTAESEAIPG